MPRNVIRSLAACATAAALALTTAPAAQAAPAVSAQATADSFYTYTGSTPLASYTPGAVLNTRTFRYQLAGLSTPVQVTQILYRSTDAQGRPSANVTSVLRSPYGDGRRAVSYQSAYDSLNPEHGPSRAIAGNAAPGGGVLAQAETALMLRYVLAGYTLVMPDTEGQQANFAAGPEYGTNTLDSLRAAAKVPGSGVDSGTRFGLIGYSGGAIATHWAAALAPRYAPDINKKLVGFSEGGLLVKPAHNLKYVSGSKMWSGVIPMAVIGIARSYGIDFTPYLNDYGVEVMKKLEHESILAGWSHALSSGGISWEEMAKPAYKDPNSIPEFVTAVNKVSLGQAPTPTVPGYIVQGDAGWLEGTSGNPPGIGTGDGVMVSGDVRALARQYCATGNTAIKYRQYDGLSHVGAVPPWDLATLGWLDDRFDGKAAPSSCGSIPPGNSLAPERVVSPAS
ncbi:triacylglycerol lipase [Streptomyces sp. TRM66268-LWL]|uniref:Triacylglycerol lipase n=1 Tax=Streptomyces polyasparticus TaxID=2767826 RepID=A0ABR7SQU9_9ACTN|nr:lipase family protein [Streptomyces polyasparticus]MBC9717877.1 triacylglycerol lipase [Streptomyces polyasparticus]